MDCVALPKDQIVFEILEDSIPDPEFLNEISCLKAKGYRFALDDFNFQEQLLPFLPYCSFIKVDFRLVDRARLIREMPLLRSYSVKLLAEKVETVEEFQFCRSMGFEYFQGFFFCKPKIVSVAAMPTNKLNVCRLIARLHQPNVTIEEVAVIIGEDPSMSFRLLRYMNSASIASAKKIESIHHAVRMVGLDHVRTLTSLILFSRLDDKPRELIRTSVVRARMCQLLGEGSAQQLGTYFTTGLFSTLDAFLNCSMEDALELLPISDDIRSALLHSAGPQGRVLNAVIAFEKANWEFLGRMGFDPATVAEAHLESVSWSEDLLS